MSNREVIKVKDDEGNELSLAVLKPTTDQNRQAQLQYNLGLREAIENGSMLRQSLDKYMREQKLWDDEKQDAFNKLAQSLIDNEAKLARGGIKKSEAKNICIQMRVERNVMREILRQRNELDQNTAESFADQRRFDYLVSVCVVHSDSSVKYFKDLNDYWSKKDSDLAMNVAFKLGEMIYNLSDDYESKLMENKTLKQLGFVNDKLELVDHEGNRVDVLGRKVDDQGRLINSDGKLIDKDNNIIDGDGNLLVEQAPFLDD